MRIYWRVIRNGDGSALKRSFEQPANSIFRSQILGAVGVHRGMKTRMAAPSANSENSAPTMMAVSTTAERGRSGMPFMVVTI